jgi:hypothetical protein
MLCASVKSRAEEVAIILRSQAATLGSFSIPLTKPAYRTSGSLLLSAVCGTASLPSRSESRLHLPTDTIRSSTGRFGVLTFRHQIGDGPGEPDPLLTILVAFFLLPQ